MKYLLWKPEAISPKLVKNYPLVDDSLVMYHYYRSQDGVYPPHVIVGTRSRQKSDADNPRQKWKHPKAQPTSA